LNSKIKYNTINIKTFKDFKKEQIENAKIETKKLKIAIKENANSRFNLNEELNNIQSQLKKNVRKKILVF
jgi:hypothetical protein